MRIRNTDNNHDMMNILDPKVRELYYVLEKCIQLNKNNDNHILYTFLDCINNNKDINYSELEQNPLISQLINSLRNINITTKDSMFMSYYRVLRSLIRV